MFKFKNFKILLLLMLFAFAGKDAWATQPTYKGWHTYTAKIKVNETGLGKVYGCFNMSDGSAAHNPTAARNIYIVTQHRYASVYTSDQSSNEYNLYLYAVANESTEEGVSYEFVEWQNEKGERVKTSNQEEGTAYISKFVTTNKCGPNFTSGQGTGTNNFYQPHQDYHNSITTVDPESGISIVGHIDSTYVAVFRRVYKPRLVTVSVNDENLGFVECNPTPFDYGKEVTLLTLPKSEAEKGFENKFIGWKKDGNFLLDENGDIVRDVPLQFTVSEETQGHYEAVYESGYNFFHLVNKSTKRTVNAINDQGSITDFSSLQLVDYDERFIDAGSVFQINNYKVAGGYPHEFIVQGSNTGDYYTIDPGYSEYITIERNVDDLTWSIHPNGQPVYMADEGEGSVTTNANKGDEITHWYIECVDKDLETKENYFSLDPNKLVEVGGKYYTTLRTSWNILFNPEQMTPYIVKSVDETEGTFEMEPITGNIIPAGTPVIIETKSNDVEENRMVPTLTNAASGAVPSGNLLQHSEKYFPNQPAPVSNCKGLYKNADGQLAFGGNDLNTVNGNEAYLSVANEVVRIEKQPLAKIEKDGVKNGKYIVEDQLVVIYADVDKGMLWCKDQGNKSIAKTEKQDGQIDYMREITKEQKKDWDQSNWVMLQFEQPAQNSDLENLLKTATGKYIEPASIKGTYSDINNYTITMANQTLQLIDGGEPYVKNLYCTANFLPKNLNINGGEGAEGIYHGEPAHYFFMNPKVQEVCEITYALWDGEKFVVPDNDSQIDGAFTVDWTLNEEGPITPTTGEAYRFVAVVNRTQNSGYLKSITGEPSSDFIIYPLNLDPENNNNVITSIGGVQTSKTVTRVVYYNLMGVESDVPHPGINIVEKRYSDGSRSVEKVIR